MYIPRRVRIALDLAARIFIVCLGAGSGNPAPACPAGESRAPGFPQ
jgi:hypothetical protein